MPILLFLPSKEWHRSATQIKALKKASFLAVKLLEFPKIDTRTLPRSFLLMLQRHPIPTGFYVRLIDVNRRLAWLRAGAEAFSPDPLRSGLWKAYLSLNDQQIGLLGSNPVHTAIAHIQNTSSSCPHLTRLTLEHEDLRQGRLFHQTIAGSLKRKHNKSEYYFEHDLRVTEKCIAYYIQKTGRDPSPQTVLGWLCHDSVEEYGVTFRQIGLFCGDAVANAVRPVTIPKLEVLQKLYPWLTKKIELKNQFKADSNSDYAADDVILRFFDNLDAITSYTKDMDQRLIFVSDNEAHADQNHKPPIFWHRDLIENLFYRRQANQALLDRCTDIAHDAKKNPMYLDTVSMAKDFEHIFLETSDRFRRAISSSVEHYLKKPTAPSPRSFLSPVRAGSRFVPNGFQECARAAPQ